MGKIFIAESIYLLYNLFVLKKINFREIMYYNIKRDEKYNIPYVRRKKLLLVWYNNLK